MHAPLIVISLALIAPAVGAQTAEQSQARLQSTYVYQSKPAFNSPYSGPRSLGGERERSYTFTGTAFLGTRAWQGGELYLDAEAIRGLPLSEVSGLGGLTNGELQKVAGPQMKLYVPRVFVRQTFMLGGEKETVESDINQLGGSVDSHRLVITVGKLGITDLFTKNEYAGDPRTQFLNWSFLTYGAFDYAADLRGYSWGAALEYDVRQWSVRAARFEQPKTPNSSPLDHRIFSTYGDQVELERRHEIGGLAGKLQFLAYRNVATMASYADALAAAQGGTPDLGSVRRSQSKVGAGVALEQALATDVGLFARLSRHDGKTETYAFSDIDSSFTAGALLKGARWARANDSIGIALARNAISTTHREYLAAGGSTFFLGDGRLNYRPEEIFESFYSLAVTRRVFVSADWQHIRNPGYNADRGPVHIASLRLHAEF